MGEKKENNLKWLIKKTNNEKIKGITLIALVVTIIVLLILASITLQLLLTEGGIIQKAKEAIIATEIGELKDKIYIHVLDWNMNKKLDANTQIKSLWEKLVKDNIINSEEDVVGPRDENVYDITTKKGYVVEIIVDDNGNVTVGEIIKQDDMPIEIEKVISSYTTNSIHIEVEIKNLQQGSITYSYKIEGEPDENYQAFKKGTKDLTADLTRLQQDVIYNIQIEAKNGSKKATKVVNVRTGEIPDGTIRKKGETLWNNGLATIELETTETQYTMQYQINTYKGNWIDYNGPISGLSHTDIVYARLYDGVNGSAYATVNILDNIPPVVNNCIATADKKGNITINLDGSDNETGIAQTLYSKDNINWQASNIIKVENTGEYTVYAKVIDKAGNEKIVNTQVSVQIMYTITYKWALNTLFTKEVPQNSVLPPFDTRFPTKETYEGFLSKADISLENYGDEDRFYGYFYDSNWENKANNGDIVTKDIELYLGTGVWYLYFIPTQYIGIQMDKTYKDLGLTPIESDIFQHYENIEFNHENTSGYGIIMNDISNLYDGVATGYIKYQDSEGNIYTVRYSVETCLKENTEILIEEEDEKKRRKRKYKKIQDITYRDKLVVWDFDKGEFTTANPLWIKKPEVAVCYNLLKFSDGSQLCTIDQHRIFNKEAGKFTYPMTDQTPIGTTTYNSKGKEVTLISKEVVKENVLYYNIITKYHMNLFADNILTSCRLNNLYPIENMKFVKNDKKVIEEKELEGIPQEYIDGLRLKEQSPEINVDNATKIAKDLKGYVQNLLRLKK